MTNPNIPSLIEEMKVKYPPVTELLPVEYGKWLEEKGWSMTSFENENENREKRAVNFHENLLKEFRTALETIDREAEQRGKNEAVDELISISKLLGEEAFSRILTHFKEALTNKES